MVGKGFVFFVSKVHLSVIYFKKKNLKSNSYSRGKYFFKKNLTPQARSKKAA